MGMATGEPGRNGQNVPGSVRGPEPVIVTTLHQLQPEKPARGPLQRRESVQAACALVSTDSNVVH